MKLNSKEAQVIALIQAGKMIRQRSYSRLYDVCELRTTKRVNEIDPRWIVFATINRFTLRGMVDRGLLKVGHRGNGRSEYLPTPIALELLEKRRARLKIRSGI